MLSEDGEMKQDWPREAEVKILDLNIEQNYINLYYQEGHIAEGNCFEIDFPSILSSESCLILMDE